MYAYSEDETVREMALQLHGRLARKVPKYIYTYTYTCISMSVYLCLCLYMYMCMYTYSEDETVREMALQLHGRITRKVPICIYVFLRVCVCF